MADRLAHIVIGIEQDPTADGHGPKDNNKYREVTDMIALSPRSAQAPAIQDANRQVEQGPEYSLHRQADQELRERHHSSST
jgi:hypothetical protein